MNYLTVNRNDVVIITQTETVIVTHLKQPFIIGFSKKKRTWLECSNRNRIFVSRPHLTLFDGPGA